MVRLSGYNINNTFGGWKMFEYITAQEAAKKWNVSVRWVQRLCKEKRIDGIININRVWLIPKEAEKPTDGRYRKSGDVDEL